MPKVHHVKKSIKEFPGIPKGSEYWWWSFMRGPTVRSLTPPRPWQLTRSEFLSQYLHIGDVTVGSLESWDDVRSLVEELETLRYETQDKYDNMPEGLQGGDTGLLLQDRVDGLEEWIGHIEGLIDEDEEFDAEAVRGEIADGDPGIS
jgi:hypothetical protein